MSTGQGNSSAHAPESGVKGETSGTGLGPGGQHQGGSSGSSSRSDNAPESGTKGNSNAGQSQSKLFCF